MLRRLFLVTGALLATIAPAAAQTWTIDPNHSAASFAIRYAGVSIIRGEFQKMTGTVEFDGKDVTKAVAIAEIDAASINTRLARRDERLRGDEFFDVAKFPTITFKSSRIESAGAGTFRMTGSLTIRGVTKEVVLTGPVPATPVSDGRGTLMSGTTATTRVNRKDFGIVYNRLFEGVAELADDVELTLDIQLRRKL